MNRKLIGTISSVVALMCATLIFDASASAGGAPGGAPPAMGAAGAPGGAGRGPSATGGGAMGGRGGGAVGGRGAAGRGAPPGPPATVPAAVAIPRPTAEEVAKINAVIQKFVDTNASPDKELLKKYAPLMTVQVPRDNSAIRPTSGGGRGGQPAQTDFDIMLLGDSITSLLTVADDGGGNPGGKSVMDKYLAGTKYANFGVPGDSTQGVLGRLLNGLGQGHKPKAVMLLIGTNNNGNTAEEIAEGVGADVWELRRDFPDAKILLMGIFPRGATLTDAGRVRVAQCNKIISKLDDQKHVFFMDLTSKMVAADGKLIGFRTTDNLHPVVEGFDIWIANAAPLLKDWVK